MMKKEKGRADTYSDSLVRTTLYVIIFLKGGWGTEKIHLYWMLHRSN